MGAATNVTGFAGGTITFNSNDIDSLQGQFFAKTFTSSGTAGGSSTKYLQNYAHDSTANLTDADYAKVNPTMISENITGADMIQWYGNKNSFVFSKSDDKVKDLSYYLQNSPPDAEIAKAIAGWSIPSSNAGYADAIKQFNAKKDTIDKLSDFPVMSSNGISSFADASQNITDISDYYASFTSTNYSNSKATGSTTKYNNAIKRVDLNTDKSIDAEKYAPGKTVIQLTVDMNTTSTDQGVVFADIDGSIPSFEDAIGIKINLVNFDINTMKMPFFMLNYKHFSNNDAGISFNFSQGSWMTFNAYPPKSNGSSLDYKLAGNSDGTLFSGQNSNGSDTTAKNLLSDEPVAIDTTDKNSKKVKSVYNTSSHISNNFNTENGKIFVGSWKSPLYGSVLAPSADVDVDSSSDGLLYGSIVTGQNIIGNLNVPSDLAYQSIFDASDDFGDDAIQEFLKDPDSSNSSHPTIKSISLPGYTSTDTGSGTTHYIPRIDPYDFHYSLNNITDELPENTVQTTKKSLDTTVNVDTKSTTNKTEKYYLWYSFNNGPWEKYSENGTTELTNSKLEITAKDADYLAKQYSTDHSKYQYDESAYTDGTTYSKLIDDNELIGYHLFHKNRISYLVTSTHDTGSYPSYGNHTINDILSGKTNDTISAANLAKLDPDYTPISYNLHVAGDLLVSYPKVFDFGNFTAGTSEKTPTVTATGLLTVDNPFGLNWNLVVSTSDKDNLSDPFFIPDQLGWFEKLQTSMLGNSTITYGNASDITTIKSKDTLLNLNSTIFNSDTTSIISKNYYSSQLSLSLKTKKIIHPGKFQDNAIWSLSSPSIAVDPSKE